MRIELTLSHHNPRIPFSHRHELAAAIHRWMGHNSLHGRPLNPLAFGDLQKMHRRGDALMPATETLTWWVGCWEKDVLERVIAGIEADPHVAFGLRVWNWRTARVPDFQPRMRWWAETPVVVRRGRGAGQPAEYLLWDSVAASHRLRGGLVRRMNANGLQVAEDEIDVRFDRGYRGAKTRLNVIDGVAVRGSVCPVWVEGPALVQQYVWACGLGALTGMGFGAMRL